jgi:hypothetical protein
MKALKKFSRLIAEVNGKFVRSDGFVSNPLNTKRRVNTNKLCDDILDAKNFYFFQEDISTTKQAFPNVRFFHYDFTLTTDNRQEHNG